MNCVCCVHRRPHGYIPFVWFKVLVPVRDLKRCILFCKTLPSDCARHLENLNPNDMDKCILCECMKTFLDYHYISFIYACISEVKEHTCEWTT